MFAAEPRLNQTSLRRLRKLATAAGRTPRAMLRFVLRDGFAETERVVQAVLAGRAAVAAGRAYSRVLIMRKLDDVLSSHGWRPEHLGATKSSSKAANPNEYPRHEDR